MEWVRLKMSRAVVYRALNEKTILRKLNRRKNNDPKYLPNLLEDEIDSMFKEYLKTA